MISLNRTSASFIPACERHKREYFSEAYVRSKIVLSYFSLTLRAEILSSVNIQTEGFWVWRRVIW